MGQSNIDNMFQLIAPVADRTTSTARFGGDAAGFDDHLSQASTSVFDVARPPSRSDSTSSYSTSDSIWSASSYTSTTSDSAPIPVESSTSRKERDAASSSTSTSNQPAEKAAAGQGAKTTDRDEHDSDHANESDDGGLAGAAQAANGAPVKAESLPATDADKHANTKDVAAAELAVKQHAQHTAQAEGKPQQVETEAGSEHTEAAASVTTDETPGEPDTDESGVKKVESEAAATKPANAAPHEKVAHAEAAVTLAVNTEQPTEETIAATGTDAAAVTEDKPAAKASDKSSTAAKRSAGSNATTNDESPGDPDSATTDSAAPVAKTDATVIGNGIAANVTADTTSKGDAVTDTGDQPSKIAAAKTEASTGPLDRATRGTTELTRGNGSAKPDETTTRVDPARFVSRVAKAFQTANERGGTLQLRLSPPELGALKIQLTVKDGVMSAAMETENAGARRVLLEHLPALRDRLAEQNIRIERFDVEVRQENTGGQANPHGSNQNPYQPQPEPQQQRRTNGAQQSATEAAVPDAIPLSAKISSTKINLVV